MTVELSSPVWRSLLYVPANVERYVAKAHERGADGIILDLEDSIPLAEKRNARDNIQSAMRSVGQHGGDVLVRINRPLNLAVRDIQTSVFPDLDALVIPKVIGPEHITLLDEVVTALEYERGLSMGSIRFLAMIESPEAFFKINYWSRRSGIIARYGARFRNATIPNNSISVCS